MNHTCGSGFGTEAYNFLPVCALCNERKGRLFVLDFLYDIGASEEIVENTVQFIQQYSSKRQYYAEPEDAALLKEYTRFMMQSAIQPVIDMARENHFNNTSHDIKGFMKTFGFDMETPVQLPNDLCTPDIKKRVRSCGNEQPGLVHGLLTELRFRNDAPRGLDTL